MNDNRVGDKELNLRVAVVGAGKMGLNHVRAIQASKLGRVVGVADPNAIPQQVHQAAGSEIPIFGDAETLLAETRPDVVHVCTPPSTHPDVAELALQREAHVYVEKPFALSKAEADRVLGLASRVDRKVCAGHQLLFERPARRIRRHLDRIGRVVHVESFFSFRQVRRNITPVEQVLDILPHPTYVLLDFMSRAGELDEECTLESALVKPDGSINALVKLGAATGSLTVTLAGRPVESFVRVVGTNGTLHADFVLGATRHLLGPGTSKPAVILNRFAEARQTLFSSVGAVIDRVVRRRVSYPGLSELIDLYYESILGGTEPPISAASIRNTVSLCEGIGTRLRREEHQFEEAARGRLTALESSLPPTDAGAGAILVTGGTGFLGKEVAAKCRAEGFGVRIACRQVPPVSLRLPAVEYRTAELAQEIDPRLMEGVSYIVHAAAETAGGKEAHARNSVASTENVMKAAARAGVRGVIQVSSIGILTQGADERPIREDSPLVTDESRGPYVWGKAQSELLALRLGRELDVDVRVIRPGPLVDFDRFEPPGRLGRELGNVFVAVGGRQDRVSVCDVSTAATVIVGYARDFDAMPRVLNLLESDAPTRESLARRHLAARPELKCFWLPKWFVTVLSPVLILVQKIVRPSTTAVNIKEAFFAPEYDVSLARRTVGA